VRKSKGSGFDANKPECLQKARFVKPLGQQPQFGASMENSLELSR
jgi:hypothetical protein